MTDSMRAAIGETTRRRGLQEEYNRQHGITPQSIVKRIDEVMSSVYERDYATPSGREGLERFGSQAELDTHIAGLQAEMQAAAANLDFEKAAALRDEIQRISAADLGLGWPTRSA